MARLIIIFGMPFFVLGILIAGPATTILFGKAYTGARGVVALMLIVGFLAIIVSTLETNIISQGKTYQQFVLNIINAVVFISMAYMFIPLLAHWGLALSYLVTEFVAFCVYGYIFVRHSRFEFMRLIRPIILSGITISLVFMYIQMNITAGDIFLRIILMLFALTMTFFMMDMKERGLIKRYVRIR
jgi:O-antigen/teichoic acid export membrane protein